MRSDRTLNVEPDAEPPVEGEPQILDELDEAATLAPELPVPRRIRAEPNAEDFMQWMLER